MPVELYGMDLSPPCRTVRLVANHLGVELKFKVCDVLKGENKTPQFAKLDVTQTIPVIKDGDLRFGESRAIICYLLNAYGKDSVLYSADVQKQATTYAMLQFDLSMYQKFGSYFFPSATTGVPFDNEKKEKLEEALGTLESILKKNNYVTGSQITIADHSMLVSVTTFEGMGVNDLSKYPNIKSWIEKCSQEIPEYEELSGKFVTPLGDYFKGLLKKNGLI